MQRIFYIALITGIFFVMGSVVIGHWSEALPVTLIGACLGWAFTEFKRETHQQHQQH